LQPPLDFAAKKRAEHSGAREQFPSHYYAWQRLAQENGGTVEVVPWPDDHDWTAAVLKLN